MSIFVFGSNLSGIHGAGAARVALEQHGAIWGKSIGPMGSSYAIPTKDYDVKTTLLPQSIKYHVQEFMKFAKQHNEVEFQVTCIGCGLAGLKHRDIAPMFVGSPDNCYFDTLWRPYLGNVRYWGTY